MPAPLIGEGIAHVVLRRLAKVERDPRVAARLAGMDRQTLRDC